MKQLLIVSMLVAGSLVAATSAKAQVRVDAHVGFGAPAPVVVYENDYPGYSYYEYPAWRGHYHDRAYYQHYHYRFEREHRPYFENRRFNHERFERENHWGGHRDGDRGRGHNDHARGDHHRN